MSDSYRTIKSRGQAETVIKKSRFIGYAAPVASEEEALSFVEGIKKQHYNARHNCYAFAIGNENTLYRFSDDGEPQGTAGKPILEVITGQDMVNICIVVTRYFGGTLLGTGGLVRAYTEAAKLALDDAGAVTFALMTEVYITTNYNDSGKVSYLLNSSDILIEDTRYEGNVTFHTLVPAERTEEVIVRITDATAARAEITRGDERFLPLDRS